METLKLRKMNAGKPEVMQRLKNSEKQKYGELLEKAMPIKFSDHFLTSSWTSHSSVFGVNLAPCWLPAWLHVGSMLASSWPHVGSSWLENRPKCVPNRSTRLSERVLGVSWGASGGAWGPSRLQDGFKTPKVKVLTPSWRPSWRPKSIKNRI